MSAHEHDADMTPAEDPDDKRQKKEHGHGHGHGHSHSHEHNEQSAKIVALGAVTVGGATFTIDREGMVEAGKETEFGVELIGGSGVPSAAWLQNPDGEKLCDPVSSEDHDQHWHFKVTPLVPVKKSQFMLKCGAEEVAVDWARGHQPCNGGILSVFKVAGGARCGFVEIKLHGDAGDLEVFLYTKAENNKPKPFDIPKETVITLAFPNHENKTVTCAVRNMDQNEDEDGKANMRGNGTNYFIFPGESGQDPEWLVGEKWRGLVKMSFEADGKAYECDPFVLVPHDAL